jgi:S-adenosylmethionine-diacylglycerol 3-amino-3-carboxypropyl transferase
MDYGTTSTSNLKKAKFGTVWEDADILCDALSNASGGRILSVTSAGDNVLALLTIDPKEIVAADASPAQLACLELRMSAFRHLDYFGLLAFMGVTASPNRIETYQELRSDLSEYAKAYWDCHKDDINQGIIHAGRFEGYIRAFSHYILPLVVSKAKREALFQPRSHLERIAFYDNEWDSFRWRLLFRIILSRIVTGKSGKNPQFFDHIEGDNSYRLLRRTKHAMTELPTQHNPYLNYVIRGNFTPEALPRYLRPEYKETIASRLDRIKLVCSPVEEAGSGKFDGFNLADIFEFMDPAAFQNTYQKLFDKAAPKGRLVYWNLLEPHEAPEAFESKINPQPELSDVLHWRDKGWFYQALHIDEAR